MALAVRIMIIVDIKMNEVCAQVNLNDLEGSQLGESCDPDSELVRKRRNWFMDTFVEPVVDKGEDVYNKVKEPFVDIYCEFKSKIVNEAYSFGKKQALTFSKKVEEISLRIADETVNVYKKIEGFTIDSINFFKKVACRAGQGFGLLGKLIFQKNKDTSIPLATTKAPDNISFKLHQWMRYLPKTTRNLPLTMIAIPGTHDSATHTMKTDHKTSPDSDLYQKNLIMSGISNSLLRSLGVNGIVSAWGKCVKHTIEEQLLIGIRSFDFR